MDAPAGRPRGRLAAPHLDGLGLLVANYDTQPAGDDVNERVLPRYHRVTGPGASGPRAQTMPPAERSSTPSPTARSRLNPLHWLLPSRNPAEAVYGIVTVGALLAAESGLRETYPETVGSLIVAVVLYWFAHSYADVLGLRLSKRGQLTWAELWHTFVQEWAIVRGAAAPTLAVVVAWAVGAPQSTAVSAGVWAAVGSLIALELLAGLRSKAKAPEMVLQVTVGVTLGLGILALRALLH